MPKKYQNRLRELARLQAKHGADQVDQSSLHVNVKTVSADSHADELHSHHAHSLVRKDLASLLWVAAGALVILFTIYWLLQTTSLEASLVSLFRGAAS